MVQRSLNPSLLPKYSHYSQRFVCIHKRGIVSLKSSKLRQFQKQQQQENRKVNESKTDEPISISSRHPKTPARTRFAPSPTGFVHLGSLRTALYNYLLAKNTGGQFLLRLEDTDQKRLVQGAEEGIYKWLKWAGLQWDEGPDVGGKYGPYRQSERSQTYAKYATELMDNGHAYRCFCSKERLDGLRDSARKLHPPSMASYDRKCENLSSEESDLKVKNGESFTVRFKSPIKYPEFHDILHGKLNLQTQVNYNDLRYEDPVLVKSDGLPTYHLANVVDDHLMKITHVVRGEEWLLSAPKHVALYNAFGWEKPNFIHIPLLTSTGDKKLSKRSGDSGIEALANKGILPEALVNFVALFGWSPVENTRNTEVLTLNELINEFTLDGLTKGNAKVDDKKLDHFNQVFFKQRLDSPLQRQEIINKCHLQVKEFIESTDSDIPNSIRQNIKYTENILDAVKDRVSSPVEFKQLTEFLYKRPSWDINSGTAQSETTSQILRAASAALSPNNDNNNSTTTVDNLPTYLIETLGYKKKHVFKALRYGLAGGISGLKIPEIIRLLGNNVVKERLSKFL